MVIYYISTSGNDTTGDGSSGNPWLTISKAHTSASSGDTIIVKTSTSTYAWSGLTFAKNITIQGETTNPDNHIFSASATLGTGWITGAYTVNLYYLTFKNCPAVNDTYPIFGMASAGTCVFDTCKFYDNIITGPTRTSLFGFQTNGSVTNFSFTCRNSLIYNIRGTNANPALWLSVGGGTGGSINFINNTIHLTNTGTYPLATVYTQSNATTHSLLWKNNIMYSFNAAYAFKLGTVSFVTTYNYNDTYQMTTLPTGTGNITSDPLFVDITTLNYNLRPTSPCIDTGSNV